MIGRVVSHYEILEKVGAGGMGVVYRARDTSLGRDVALKVLPAEFVQDAERVARFKREAEALASLDHPNIVTIFAVEEAEGLRFLTMQLVQGRSLETLLSSGSLPLEKALRIGAGIAEALGAAHQHGVVHRDLKPGNVMITTNGHVKVLDFGLAKLSADSAADATPELSRMSTEQLTAAGTILGTTPYMSPEQAEGRAIDHRSDIFSLGVVLYEMVTGKRPFRGDSTVALISSILKDVPPRVTETNPGLPVGIERIISRALAKDVEHRYQNVLDLCHDLEDLEAPQAAAPPADAVPPRARLKPRVVAAIVAAILSVAGAWSVWRFAIPRSPAPAPSGTFAKITALPGVEQHPSLSPDGEWVTYSGIGPAGDLDIYLQSTSGETPINLTAGSDVDDDQPAFSPDGRRIAFRSERDGGGIYVMGRTGEAVRRVTRDGFSPSWSPDGTMLVYAGDSVGLMPLNMENFSRLFVVGVDGGEPRALGPGDGVDPRWSPHGHRIVYQTRFGDNAQMDIMTVPATGGEPSALLSDAATDWSPAWSPDGRSIYFVSDRGGSMNLWWVPVDEVTGRAQGEPQSVTTPAPFAAHPSLSADGRHLAFSSVLMRQNIQAATFDETTFELTDMTWVTSGSRQWSSPDPSPDGAWVSFYSRDLPEGDIYVARADGSELRQVTSGPEMDRVPRWAPDGERISYFSTATGTFEAWTVRADGSDRRQMLPGVGASFVIWSPAADAVALNGIRTPHGLADPFIVDLATSRVTATLEPTDEALRPLSVNSWSPDGARIACMIGYSDGGVVLYDVATRAFEEVTDFGQWPVWLPDSRHLLFVTKGTEFHVVDRTTREIRKVYSTSRDVLGPPRLSADGRLVVYSRRTTEADIWMLSFE